MKYDCELINWNKELIDDLSFCDYSLFGTLSFKNDYYRRAETSSYRLHKAEWLFTRVAQNLKVPKKKIGYFIKDEVSEGIDKTNALTGHIHFLLSANHIKKNHKKLATIVNGLWVGAKGLENNLYNKQPRFGWPRVKAFDPSRKNEGIFYTAKAYKNGVIVFNDFRMSKGLKREINYYKNCS